MKVCFIGHRTVEKTEQLVLSLKQTVETLVRNGAITFLFGSMSEFDNISWEVVTQLQKEYPCIKRVYVRSAYQYIDKDHEDYLLKYYEETYFPPKIDRAGRYAYVERNYEMIDQCDCCVFYYDENYTPQKRPSKHGMPMPSTRHSGTKIAYQYAVKKKKRIINLFQ